MQGSPPTLPDSWVSTWQADKIWESSDNQLMKVVKSIFFTVAFLIGFWLVPLRNMLERRNHKILTWLCNNVPNGITIILRGLCGTVASIYLIVALATNTTIWLSTATWFFIMVGLFCTDFIDGPLARQLEYVTAFGKDADPTVDKIVSFIVAVGWAILTVMTQGVVMGVAVSFFLVVLFKYEFDLSVLAMRTREISKVINEPMHGAFGPGKVKFTLESILLGVSYGWLVWARGSLSGSIIAVALIVVALPFADKSRLLHRKELEDFRQILQEQEYPNVVDLHPNEDVA